MKLSEIIKVLDATVLTGEILQDKEFFSCGASDLMSDILAKMAEGSIILTGLSTVQAVRTAAVSGVGGLVFVRNKKPSQEIIEMAREEGILLLSTPYSMFVSCGRLYDRGLTGLNGLR
jgi:predicted transcriptional regulator